MIALLAASLASVCFVSVCFASVTIMKVESSMCKYSVVQRAASIASEGCSSSVDDDEQQPWSIFWTDTSVNHERVAGLGPTQRLNHFVDMTFICRKATSAGLLNRNARASPSEYCFVPRSWALPRDLASLTRIMKSPHPPHLIVKPNKGSQGAGISICRTLEELDATRGGCFGDKLQGVNQGVAQEYCDRPMLINGYKVHGCRERPAATCWP